MTTAEQYEIDDPTFVKDLEESRKYVWKVARWLSDRGFNVTVRPTFIRPDVDQMSEYSDLGDLEIVQRVEVKRRPNLKFQSLDEFPYTTIIVDVAHTWDKAVVKPYAYVILNGDATASIIVLGSTHSSWTKVTKYDRQKRRERTFYECPLEHCSFHRIK